MKPTFATVAVVGTGVVGRSWVHVFARAGCDTRIFDRDSAQASKALEWIGQSLDRSQGDGHMTAADVDRCRSRIRVCEGLAEAVAGATWVQETGPERLETKQAIYRDLDAVASRDAILGSSTSTLDMTEIAAELPGAHRCIVAHPVNPPHVVPAVEILPGKRTDPTVVKRTDAFMRSIGQTPIHMKRYVFGFVLNRMQAALVREAVHLVAAGIADVDAVDAAIRDGLGLRWAFMGPFGVANTNADGGVREYFTKYHDAYIELMNDLGPTPSFDKELIERLGEGTDTMEQTDRREDLRSWRDRVIMAIREVKAAHPHP